jgi:hypothetical protein
MLAQRGAKMSHERGSTAGGSCVDEQHAPTSSSVVLSINFNNKQRSSWKEARLAYDRLKSDPKKSATWGNTYAKEADGQQDAFTLHCAGCNHSIQLKNPSKFFSEHKCPELGTGGVQTRHKR